ncbi:MAG TPA: ParB/RepB/Spo0J family partition protein [Chloroflexota bacterium]|nr:ParB/RepB/Spo0J family partition protein [Chloroflexota bacterium]
MAAALDGLEMPAPTATGDERAARSARRKESLTDVLRRRSADGSKPQQERASAAQVALNALTRNGEARLVDVPLEALQPNPFQPRFHFNRQPLEDLAQSLAAEGQLEPVIARRVSRDGQETLEIVAGARRLEAAKICHATIKPFPTLRADIRDLTDEEAERISLIENLQRENLTPLEEGYRYWQLQQRDPARWSVRAIAEFVHKKKSTVQNRLGLVREPAIAEAVLREQIPPTAGFHIMRLPAPEREAYLRVAAEQQLTVEQIKVDIDRRLASRRAPVITRLEARQLRTEPGEADDSDGEDGTFVRAHLRRRKPVQVAAASNRAERLNSLVEERSAVQTRIEELEAEVRAQLVRLRAIDRELAALRP